MVMKSPNGDRDTTFLANDMSLRIDRAECTGEKLRVIAERNEFEWPFDFTLNRDSFFEPVNNQGPQLTVRYRDDELAFGDFLNEYPLYFYFADLSRLRGEEWFPCKIPIEPFDRELIKPIPWGKEKVEIKKEYWKQNERGDNGKQSIHEFIEKMLAQSENSVIFYDHRSGEIADFLTLSESGTRVALSLYHCKASGAEKPGDRLGDAYEVCGQVVKSFNLIDNEKDLISHVRRRAKSGSRFVKGDTAAFERALQNRGARSLEYEFVIVQPGISKQYIGEDSAAVLAAAYEYVRNIGAKSLIVLGSD